ncbi:MAG TPA: hypothetical protein VNI83_13615 [Vicinamibacterales bacterium]|nr:hypothetical protein [Vicinamibacterales bacterium]
MPWQARVVRSLLICVLLAGVVAGEPATSREQDSAAPAALARWFTEGERRRLAAGHVVVASQPRRGDEVAMAAAVAVDVDGERFVAWMQHIDQLYRSRFVPAIARFSARPRLADLDGLTLDHDDLEDLRRCRPGDCGLKLSAAEMAAIRRAIRDAGQNWRRAAEEAFRQAVLGRVDAFLDGGHDACPPYEDHLPPVHPADELAALLAGMPSGWLPDPTVLAALKARTVPTDAPIESFLYWAKEAPSGSKPLITVTRVMIHPGAGPAEITVTAEQVYASHYLTASLTVTALLRDAATGRAYLVYLRRARADVFRGVLGKLVHRALEGRMRSAASAGLATLRARLERAVPVS